MNKKLLIACSMGELWTTLGQAQTPIPAPWVPAGEVAAEREQLKDLSHRKKTDLKRIDAREAAAIDGVREDKSLPADEKQEKIAAITKDARKDREELHEKFEARREALRRDIKKDLADLRGGRRDYVNARRDALQDIYYSRR